jgi:pimeloyl-ACP methyl ester carboxylesterase
MEGLRPHFAKIGGVRLRWFEGGDGAPLALLHGLGGAASNWTLVAPALAERFRVLVPDLPGHGGSGGPPRGSDLGWQADALAELLRSRDAAGAAVVGHSMGGVVGLRLAVRRPEAVSALALVETAGIASLTRSAAAFFGLSALFKPARRAARFRERIAKHEVLRRAVFGYWGAYDAGAMPPAAVHGWLESAAAHVDTRTAARALLSDDPRYDLDRVTCPTLVVWGAHDRLISVEDGFEFARRLRAPIRVVPGAGHLLIGERPEECAAILAEWLDGVRQVDEHPLDAELVGDPSR